MAAPCPFVTRLREDLPLSGIAERLHMGSRGHLAWLLERPRKSPLAVRTDQCCREYDNLIYWYLFASTEYAYPKLGQLAADQRGCGSVFTGCAFLVCKSFAAIEGWRCL
jgi:hypothetical protein